VTARHSLRRYFITGLVVLAPVGATVAILVWMFNTFDAILGTPLQRVVGVRIPGLGVVLLTATIFGIGWLAHYAVGRQLIAWWNGVLAKFPVAGRIYNTSSQVVQAVLGGGRRVFLRTVLVEFPTPGSYAIAWVTAEQNPVAEAVIGEPCVNVFVATTPNPTSGFLLVVPRSRTRPVDLTIEEGMKLVISAGALLPSDKPPQGGLDLSSLLAKTGP